VSTPSQRRFEELSKELLRKISAMDAAEINRAYTRPQDAPDARATVHELAAKALQECAAVNLDAPAQLRAAYYATSPKTKASNGDGAEAVCDVQVERVRPRILLTDTSWSPMASRLAIALTKAGCDVSAIFPRHGHPLEKTRVVQQRFFYSAFDPLGSVRRAIGAVDPDVVLPCDDRAIRHLHQLHSQCSLEGETGASLTELVERSLGACDSYPVVTSRYALLMAAREEGIRIPETRRVTSEEELLPGNILKLPWVLKTDGTWGGHGVKIAQQPEDAQDRFAELSKPLSTVQFVKRLLVDRDPYWRETWWRWTRPAITMQSYIEGRPANCAVACWKGEVLAGIAVEVVNAQGATGAATIVRVVEGQEMLMAAKLLARRLNLSGLFGLDFMIEDATGLIYLIEMNPRCTPLSHLQLGEGRDLMAALAARASGTPLRVCGSVTEKETVAYFPQAWHWDPKSELLKSSHHDVPWEEPDLVQELLRLPWPDRSVLARITNLLRRTTFGDRASRGGALQATLAIRSYGETSSGRER
jgi:hypothetical protein